MATKRHGTTITREKRGKNYYYVARKNNRIITSKKVKGSNIKTIQQAKEVYKKNNTFSKTIRLTRYKHYTKSRQYSKLLKKNVVINSTDIKVQQVKDKKFAKSKYSQLKLTIMWKTKNGKRIGETESYSDFDVSYKKAYTQALGRGHAEAYRLFTIKYDHPYFEVMKVEKLGWKLNYAEL